MSNIPSIDLSKKYNTRDGREVRDLTAIDDQLQGEVLSATLHGWHRNGKFRSDGSPSPLDLIEKEDQKEITSLPQPESFSDDHIREWWRQQGGSFYGPKVEHADIEESKFLPLMRGMLQRIDQLEKALLVIGEGAVIDFDDATVGEVDKLAIRKSTYNDWLKALFLEGEKIRTALHQIAGCSPCMWDAGLPTERSCKMCLTLIDLAREAFNYEAWPAIAHTPKKA